MQRQRLIKGGVAFQSGLLDRRSAQGFFMLCPQKLKTVKFCWQVNIWGGAQLLFIVDGTLKAA